MRTPNWLHPLSNFPNRTVTISVGDFRVAVRIPAVLVDDDGWHDPPGLSAAMVLDIDVVPDEPRPDAEFRTWSEDGFELAGKYANGRVCFDEGLGHLTVRTGTTSPQTVLHAGILEAAMAVLLHQVTRAGGMMLHAASLALGGEAHVIFGRSGAGKTTIAERLPTAFLNEEYAFLIPKEAGWQWLWYPQSRAPKVERPSRLQLGRLLALSTDRSRTVIEPLPSAATMLEQLMPSVFWLPGMPTQLLMAHSFALVSAHPIATLSHSLKTPAEVVAGVITGDLNVL